MKIFLALMALVAVASAEKLRFDHYKVLRITPQTEEQAKFIAGLEDKGLNFWDGPAPVGKASDIMFPPHMQGDLLEGIKKMGMKVEKFVENVQDLIDAEASVKASPRLDWTAYYSYDQIVEWMQDMATNYSHLAKIGQLDEHTYEGRPIHFIEINRGNTNKPTIWVDANIHAREWITNTIATYLINELCTKGETTLNMWTQKFNWVIVPMLNPDGYEFSRASNRLWRKTRTPNPGSTCLGTDANRNWGYRWMEGGASNNPCSDTYGGPEVFSEVETRSVRRYMMERKAAGTEWVFYLSLHSYSQLILISFGTTQSNGQPEYGPDYANHLQLGNQAAQAHAARYNTRFQPGNIVDLLYVASGGSMDWALGHPDAGVPLGVTYELRDTGLYGFVLPPSQILPSCLEFIDGLHVYMNHLEGKWGNN
jgi:hypothetical protein